MEPQARWSCSGITPTFWPAGPQALCRLGDLSSAQASCDAAVGQQGLTSYPWVARGELMLARKQNTVEYCFDKAVQLDNDWLVRLEIADIYLFYGRAAGRQGCWRAHGARQAVEHVPNHAYCLYRQGVCEVEVPGWPPARRSFERCSPVGRRPTRRRGRAARFDAQPPTDSPVPAGGC